MKKTKRVICKSGLVGWQCRLKENYSNYLEFESYCEIYNLHIKLGFELPIKAWKANPIIQGSTNPDDFCMVEPINKLTVFDNDGETFDRYTILDNKTGEMIGASEHPFSPLGFGQHCGNVADNYWNVAHGYSWRRNIDKRLLNKRIQFAVNYFLADCSHVGRKIEFDQLPADVQQFAKQSFS